MFLQVPYMFRTCSVYVPYTLFVASLSKFKKQCIQLCPVILICFVVVVSPAKKRNFIGFWNAMSNFITPVFSADGVHPKVEVQNDPFVEARIEGTRLEEHVTKKNLTWHRFARVWMKLLFSVSVKSSVNLGNQFEQKN